MAVFDHLIARTRGRATTPYPAADAAGYGVRVPEGRYLAGAVNVVPLLEDALRSLGEEASPLRARLLARLSGALRDEPSRERRAALNAQGVEMARELGDRATLAYALDGRYSAIWGPDTAEERLGVADEIVALAEEIGDDERAFQGHHYRLAVFMETGDLPAMKGELARNTSAADALHQPAQRWYLAAIVALLALFEGRFAEAEGLVARAYDEGRHAEIWHPLGAVRLQEYELRREQGRSAEMQQPLAEVEAHYWWPWARAVATHLQAELGCTTEARSLFDAHAAADFENWPLDNDWLLGITLFADVCTFLGDSHRAETLYALLSPYESRNALGHPEFSTGSVARSLANLASTMGRFDDAERHLATALEHNTRMGARPWVAHTHHDRAMMLLARDSPGDRERAIEELHRAANIAQQLGQVGLEWKVATVLDNLGVEHSVSREPALPRRAEAPPPPGALNVFRREGEYWLVAFEGHESRLHHAKGLSYLAALLANPGREIHALDLASPTDAGARTTGRSPSEVGASSGSDDAGAVLDDQAKAEYRQRIEELQETIDEAEEWNDRERAAQARHELDFLLQELAAATGLGGRDRRMSSNAERARVNVTRAIRSSLERIREHNRELGRHLDSTIRTGTFCCYQPDPRATIDWER